MQGACCTYLNCNVKLKTNFGEQSVSLQKCDTFCNVILGFIFSSGDR